MHLGVLCFIAWRSAEMRIMAALAAAGYDDLTVSQARICARLAPDGIRMGDLAEQAQVTKQTATTVVGHLEAAGYVERVADPTDQRARLVRFAARGLRAVEVVRAAEAEIEADWVAHLGAEAAADFRAALERLREITDPWGA